MIVGVLKKLNRIRWLQSSKIVFYRYYATIKRFFRQNTIGYKEITHSNSRGLQILINCEKFVYRFTTLFVSLFPLTVFN